MNSVPFRRLGHSGLVGVAKALILRKALYAWKKYYGLASSWVVPESRVVHSYLSTELLSQAVKLFFCCTVEFASSQQRTKLQRKHALCREKLSTCQKQENKWSNLCVHKETGEKHHLLVQPKSLKGTERFLCQPGAQRWQRRNIAGICFFQWSLWRGRELWAYYSSQVETSRPLYPRWDDIFVHDVWPFVWKALKATHSRLSS